MKVNDLCKDYRAGCKSNYLCVKYEISRNTLNAILDSQGLREERRAAKKATSEAAVQAYLEGMPLKDIARKYKVPVPNLHHVLKKSGVKTNRRIKPTEEALRKALETRNKSMTAQYFGVTVETVRNWLKYYGCYEEYKGRRLNKCKN